MVGCPRGQTAATDLENRALSSQTGILGARPWATIAHM